VPRKERLARNPAGFRCADGGRGEDGAAMRARAVSVTGCAAQADRWAGAEWARGAGCGAGSTGLRARRAGRAGPCERAGALADGPKEMGARGVAWLGQLVRDKGGEGSAGGRWPNAGLRC